MYHHVKKLMYTVNIGNLPPSPDVVGLYFNDSTGEGDYGEHDARGPWNQEPTLKLVNNTVFEHLTGARSRG